MEIRFETKERSLVDGLKLPPGTTLFEYAYSNKEFPDIPEGKYWYEVDDSGKLIVTRDLIEANREPQKEDEAIFKDFTKQDTLDWWLLTYLPNETPYWQYKCISNLWYEHFTYLNRGGYYLATNQGALEICCYKKVPLQEQLEEVKMAIPLLKEFDMEKCSTGVDRPAKVLGIFEHTLSEYGVYELHIFEDTIELTKTTYGRLELVKEFENIEDAVGYIRQHLYYRKNKE
jgi:hypothetical protein